MYPPAIIYLSPLSALSRIARDSRGAGDRCVSVEARSRQSYRTCYPRRRRAWSPTSASIKLDRAHAAGLSFSFSLSRFLPLCFYLSLSILSLICGKRWTAAIKARVFALNARQSLNVQFATRDLPDIKYTSGSAVPRGRAKQTCS